MTAEQIEGWLNKGLLTNDEANRLLCKIVKNCNEIKNLCNMDWKDMLGTKAEFDLVEREQKLPPNWGDFADDPRAIENESEEGFRDEQEHQKEYEESQMEQAVFGNRCD